MHNRGTVVKAAQPLIQLGVKDRAKSIAPFGHTFKVDVVAIACKVPVALADHVGLGGALTPEV